LKNIDNHNHPKRGAAVNRHKQRESTMTWTHCWVNQQSISKEPPPTTTTLE